MKLENHHASAKDITREFDITHEYVSLVLVDILLNTSR